MSKTKKTPRFSIIPCHRPDITAFIFLRLKMFFLRFKLSPLHSHLQFCLSCMPNTKNTVYCSHQTPNEKTLVAYVFVFYFIFTVKILFKIFTVFKQT